MDYRNFLESVLWQAADIAVAMFGRVTSTNKPGDNNQVLTEADIAIGKHIIEQIEKQYPKDNIIDEEAGVLQKKSAITWVIDPIEATSNFANGSEDYGIMLGVLHEHTAIAGGVVVPSRGLMYVAQQGKGATKNGTAIHVTQDTVLQHQLVSIGINGNQENPSHTYRDAKLIAAVALAARNMRNSGCEAVDCMYVAEGIYGGRINLASQIWDNVAPQVIVEEAGGVWTDLSGAPMNYKDPLGRIGQNFVNCTAAPQLHPQLLKLINHWRKN